MNEIKKEDIKQEVFDLYDDYAHNRVNRRDFMQKLSKYAVGSLTVPALMSFLMPDYQDAIQIKGDDPRLKSEYINYQSVKGGGTIKALLSEPLDAKKKLGGIVVVHENRGLNPHIEDVARRAALAGFISIAPDALTPLGGYPGNDDQGREMQGKRNQNEMLEDFIAAYYYLRNHKDCNGKVGVVGFCFGGGIANKMAVRIHYAELDTRVNEGWPAYEAALKENGREYTAYMYANVNHGFHNDTTPRYDKAAAELAWKRTIDFFTQKLK